MSRTTQETAAPTTRPQVDDGSGDHDRYAHYVRSGDLDKAWLEGEAITALCGKKWVPSRDPSRFQVCPACKELKAQLSSG